MNNKKYFTLILLTLFFCIKSSHDLAFIYQQIYNNHPGVYNENDPNFLINLNNEYEKAKKLLTISPDNYKDIINKFFSSFYDSHCYVRWNDAVKKKNNRNYCKDNLIGIAHNDNNMVWIDFHTSDIPKEYLEKFNEVVDCLKNISLNKEMVIFDLRGNTGGNSYYSEMFVNALLGDDFACYQRAKMNEGVHIKWRASKDNSAFLRSYIGSPELEWLENIVTGMEHALKNNEMYFIEELFYTITPEMKSAKNKFTGTIVILIDRYNVSAALDFIDEVKYMHDKVILIGEQTKADRLYMDVRSIPLPSNKGIITIPMKVYNHRYRGDNIPYDPDIILHTPNKRKIMRVIKKLCYN